MSVRRVAGRSQFRCLGTFSLAQPKPRHPRVPALGFGGSEVSNSFTDRHRRTCFVFSCFGSYETPQHGQEAGCASHLSVAGQPRSDRLDQDSVDRNELLIHALAEFFLLDCREILIWQVRPPVHVVQTPTASSACCVAIVALVSRLK